MSPKWQCRRALNYKTASGIQAAERQSVERLSFTYGNGSDPTCCGLGPYSKSTSSNGPYLSPLASNDPGRLPVPPTLREMPPSHTFNSAVIAETGREARQDPNLKRLWEMPSLMVAGISYRKVTESVTLPDGKVYTSVVKEMHHMEGPHKEESEESRRHRKSHKKSR